MWLGRPVTESTWEPRDNLPCALVAEYEAGVTQDIQRNSFATGGQTVHTLSTTRIQSSAAESTSKRLKIDSTDNVSNPSGYVMKQSSQGLLLKCPCVGF